MYCAPFCCIALNAWPVRYKVCLRRGAGCLHDPSKWVSVAVKQAFRELE
jgi:hypothetical protein